MDAWLGVRAFYIGDEELEKWCESRCDSWVREAFQRRPRFEYSPDDTAIELDYPWTSYGEGLLLVYPFGRTDEPGPGVISVLHDESASTCLIAWRVALLVLRDAREKYLRGG